MAASVIYGGAGSGYSGVQLGNQTCPSGGIICAGIADSGSYHPMEWNSVDLSTSTTRDTNIYDGNNWAGDIELSPSVGTYDLSCGGDIGGAAILSGCSGTYSRTYGNPKGAATPSLTGYVDGVGVVFAIRRNGWPSVSITSGGSNLTVEASDNWSSFNNYYFRVYSFDIDDTTVEFSVTTIAHEIFTFEASPDTGGGIAGSLGCNFFKRPSGIIAPKKKFTIPAFPLPVAL